MVYFYYPIDVFIRYNDASVTGRCRGRTMLYLRGGGSLEAEGYLHSLARAQEVLDRGLLEPGVIYGALRRHAIAVSAHFSTRIEGNQLTLGQAESLLRGESVGAPPDSLQEVRNYAEAIGYVRDVAADPHSPISDATIRTIHHYVSKSLDPNYAPGRYRTEQNYVVDRTSGRVVFRPPPPEDVAPLMREFVEWLNTDALRIEPYTRAGLAHLNFVAIHPFLDGNGRTARVLETLVLYRSGLNSYELVSLEEFFGRDSQSYYAALSRAQGPLYQPQIGNVTVWIDYYLRAHATQATAAANELERYNRVLQDIMDNFSLEPGQAALIELACRTGTATNNIYRRIAEVTFNTATRHLTALTDQDLLSRVGRGRASRYEPTQRALDVFRSASAQDIEVTPQGE